MVNDFSWLKLNLLLVGEMIHFHFGLIEHYYDWLEHSYSSQKNHSVSLMSCLAVETGSAMGIESHEPEARFMIKYHSDHGCRSVS